jgi:hypothetical protein
MTRILERNVTVLRRRGTMDIFQRIEFAKHLRKVDRYGGIPRESVVRRNIQHAQRPEAWRPIFDYLREVNAR